MVSNIVFMFSPL